MRPRVCVSGPGGVLRFVSRRGGQTGSDEPSPDRPTERLQPQPPHQPVVEERYVSPGVDPNAVLLRLEDSVNSLRTGLMIVGVIAVAALGVAIYASMQRRRRRLGLASGLASDSRVSQLDDRIDRLSRQVQDRAPTAPPAAARTPREFPTAWRRSRRRSRSSPTGRRPATRRRPCRSCRTASTTSRPTSSSSRARRRHSDAALRGREAAERALGPDPPRCSRKIR